MTQKLTSFYTDTKGAIKGVRIYQVELRENLRTLFPQGQSKLSVIMRHQYYAGVRKKGITVKPLAADTSDY